MAVLRTDTEMFIRYEGTEEETATFTTLSGIQYHYNRPGSVEETEETLTFSASADIMGYVKHPGDALYIVGEFAVNDDYTVTVNSLSSVFFYEFFLWKYMYCRLVFMQGVEL